VVFQPSTVSGSSIQFNDLGNVGSVYMFPLDLRNTEYEKLSITILHDTSYQVLQGEVL